MIVRNFGFPFLVLQNQTSTMCTALSTPPLARAAQPGNRNTHAYMPAISSIQGFSLRDERPPPSGATWDVRTDRQHTQIGFLMPRLESTAKMGKAMSFSSQFGTPTKHPTEYGAQPTRYASVRDLGKVQPAAASHSKASGPSASRAPWEPWKTPQPNLTFKMSSATYARPATPSGAVGLNLVPATTSHYPSTRPTPSRRSLEVPSGYKGVPTYDGAAGRASSLLMHNRVAVGSGATPKAATEQARPGRLFTDDCGVY